MFFFSNKGFTDLLNTHNSHGLHACSSHQIIYTYFSANRFIGVLAYSSFIDWSEEPSAENHRRDLVKYAVVLAIVFSRKGARVPVEEGISDHP